MSSLNPSNPPPVRSFPAKRWLGLGLVTLLLHALALKWVDGGIVAPGAQDQAPPDVPAMQQVVVALAPPPAPAAAPAPAPRPAPRKSRPVSAPSPAVAAAPVPEMPAPVESNAISTAPPPVPEQAVPQPEQIAVVEAPPAEPAVPEPQYRFVAPPSATLKYNVEKIAANGQNYYGSGSISWLMKDGRYVVDGDAGVLFISALKFKSSGEIDRWGVAPEIYSEKRISRSATNTHFNRERQQISFSASELNYPRRGGEQDRASVIWQLSGIGRGDSAKIMTGAEIPLFVAGIRDGEVWNIRVAGQEEIEIGTGKTQVWHLVRTPKKGSYDQVLDIWLAPQMEWYPVKIRYTETNGDYLDLSLKSVRAPEH